MTDRAHRQGPRACGSKVLRNTSNAQARSWVAVANTMETAMSWTNRITIAATLIGGALALMAYAQMPGLPGHFT